MLPKSPLHPIFIKSPLWSKREEYSPLGIYKVKQRSKAKVEKKHGLIDRKYTVLTCFLCFSLFLSHQNNLVTRQQSSLVLVVAVGLYRIGLYYIFHIFHGFLYCQAQGQGQGQSQSQKSNVKTRPWGRVCNGLIHHHQPPPPTTTTHHQATFFEVKTAI